MSLGAAMFAAALLASRLSSVVAVFADMLLALVLFVLFPFLRREVRRASVPAHLVGTGGFPPYACAGTYPKSHAPMLAKVPKYTTKVPKVACSVLVKVPKVQPKYPK